MKVDDLMSTDAIEILKKIVQIYDDRDKTVDGVYQETFDMLYDEDLLEEYGED